MLIRKMEKDDLPRVVQLENDLFAIPWSINDFTFEIEHNPFSCSYVMENDGDVVGYIIYWVMYDKAEIATIGVASACQRQGIASQLLEKSIEEATYQQCENITLEVRVSNQSAIGLYKKYGFEEKTVRKNYYQDNHEDAYLMEKRIGGKV